MGCMGKGGGILEKGFSISSALGHSAVEKWRRWISFLDR